METSRFIQEFRNPFRPGAGHMPPFLAGRESEKREFEQLLEQTVILKNLILTGLRGVGKSVLLETLKPMAVKAGWVWVGTDMSESTSVNEESMATRLLTDISVITSSLVITTEERVKIGYRGETDKLNLTLSYPVLSELYAEAPGLVSDKLKAVIEEVWENLKCQHRRGVVFAYDEAQKLADNRDEHEYPLSLLLDVFQSLQRKNIPCMLILTGLPTLFPKLVEARTYSERMFRVLFLDQLSEAESRDAILKPLAGEGCPVSFGESVVQTIIEISGGYPYFIQFVCREVYDVFVQRMEIPSAPSVPVEEIERKLDSDFFAGRWARVTDRQRELLTVAATLEHCDDEFTVREIVEKSKDILKKPFGSSHVNQTLAALGDAGLVYKKRFGKYAFAVPLLSRFIRRQIAQAG